MSDAPLLDFAPRSAGPVYEAAHDQRRLSDQFHRILRLMLDGQWRSLAAIAELTGDPQSSVSAQLRHMRKPRFGGYTVERKPSGDRRRGLFVYRVLPPSPAAEQPKKEGLRAEVRRLRETIERLQARIAELEQEKA